MVKYDLVSGFYQIRLQPEHCKFYGIYYRGKRYAFTRLPMGHPLAPYVLQRLALAVARFLNQRFNIAMISYLDDWLIFGTQPPAHRIQATIEQLGFTINYRKSTLVPTNKLVYLGLQIDARIQQMQPTPQCLLHMRHLLSMVRQASPLDLRRIAGYVSWLAWAMNWPTFIATHLLQREPFWIRWALRHDLLHRPHAPWGSSGVLS
jgi:hypothetical protein